MRYLTFTPDETGPFEVCFLVPALHRADIERHYIQPHLSGMQDQLLAYDLFKDGKKTAVKLQREYLDELLPVLQDIGVKYLVTCDAEYFKTLSKLQKCDAALGYVVDCVHPGFEDMKVLYCPNFRGVFHNPEKVQKEICIALEALVSHWTGGYTAPGLDAIKFAAYPDTPDTIELWLQRLLDMDCPLSSDIEGFSLKHHSAGIGTITFCWNKHEGIAFPVDLLDTLEDRIKVRRLLKDFLETYARTGHRMLWHNISYDAYVLIYQLWMKDILDTAGLLEGLSIMLANWDDTKLITYLATNSCAKNQLGLKVQAQEFAGNYAVEEIEDIRSIPLDHLLRYNLMDGLSTWYVYEKHYDTMVADDQLEIYEELFKPAIVDIIQMQLTGLPINIEEVRKVSAEVQAKSDAALARMKANRLTEIFIWDWREAWIEKENQKLKTKTRSHAEAEAKVQFNPNSNPQLQEFLFGKDHLALPVLDYTDAKQPASGADTLEKLVNHTTDPEVLDILEGLIEFKSVDKILTSFLPHFLSAVEGPDGWHYLFGNFNLGGTISGRLSSSKPNLQNLPANGKNKIKKALAKLMKRCVKAPPGFLFIGLDFASLEDRISALTTKDPNKLKVYTDGFDGHCLRAWSYFGDQMSNNINPDDPESINSIADLHPDLRQKSKTPTFALTYQGTYITLMANSGFSKALAQKVEAAYHDLYQVSDAWVAAKIAEAGQKGYLTVAFGLRLRTPLLRQVILGTSKTPYEAAAEGRTAGNALGQSWCLLNTRAGIEFNRKVRSSKYALDIRPCAHIHDAQYFLIPACLETLMYVNEHLVKAVEWQDHPEIEHPDVKLGGEVSIYWPDWSKELVIPNGASEEKIKSLAEKHQADYPG